MLMATKIMIDAGHGGYDNGASYEGRLEKNDNLNLALALGDELERRGYEVEYTRTTDRYDSPARKAQIGAGQTILYRFTATQHPRQMYITGFRLWYMTSQELNTIWLRI